MSTAPTDAKQDRETELLEIVGDVVARVDELTENLWDRRAAGTGEVTDIANAPDLLRAIRAVCEEGLQDVEGFAEIDDLPVQASVHFTTVGVLAGGILAPDTPCDASRTQISLALDAYVTRVLHPWWEEARALPTGSTG